MAACGFCVLFLLRRIKLQTSKKNKVMESYYNKQAMQSFINYVTDSMEDNYMVSFAHEFRLSVFEYGVFLLNAPVEQVSSLFADLTFCHIITKTDSQSKQIDKMRCTLKHIIAAGLQKFNLHIN